MKALSIQQPWAWAIVAGLKRVENRTWRTRFRGRFAIHASSHAPARQDFRFLAEALNWTNQRYTNVRRDARPNYRGVIVGTATLVDVVEELDDPLFFGPYGFVLEDVRRFATPIPAKGRLQFWTVPADIEQQMRLTKETPA